MVDAKAFRLNNVGIFRSPCDIRCRFLRATRQGCLDNFAVGRLHRQTYDWRSQSTIFNSITETHFFHQNSEFHRISARVFSPIRAMTWDYARFGSCPVITTCEVIEDTLLGLILDVVKSETIAFISHFLLRRKPCLNGIQG